MFELFHSDAFRCTGIYRVYMNTDAFKNGDSHNNVGSPMINFLLWTFGLTWLVWIPVALFRPREAVWLVPVVIVGAFMPSIMGIVLGGIATTKNSRREFWLRLVDIRRIKGRYWLLVLVLAPVMNIAGFLVSRAFGGPAFSVDTVNFGNIGAIAGFLLFILISGPLAEELGWRGMLLPELLKRHNAITATAILGLIWITWHLPLFWIEGTAQQAQGLFTLEGLQWIVEVMALSVFVSWFFVNTGWSTLGAVFIHFMDNLSFTVFAGADYERDPVAGVVVTVLYVLLAVAILLTNDRKTLKKSKLSTTVQVDRS